MVLKYGTKERIAEKRITYIKKFFSVIVYSVAFLCFALIWGIDFRGIFIFASSFFAVVGIAMFASWSVLSNITSSIILFFSFPYKIGDQIKILDGDNTISGKLQDITMFNLQIEDEEGNIITVPNNLAIQKAIIKYNQRKRDSV
jgi:small-conductance mechanosensitive channel